MSKKPAPEDATPYPEAAKTNTYRVPQGMSVTYEGIRYHQGQEFQAPPEYTPPAPIAATIHPPEEG